MKAVPFVPGKPRPDSRCEIFSLAIQPLSTYHSCRKTVFWRCGDVSHHFHRYNRETAVPKENTHLFLINGIMEAMDHADVRGILRANYDALCFGGIMADTFFYSSNKDVVKFGEVLHGKDGEKTNWLTFELLDHARHRKCEKFLSLSMGYISHCVFDITFHPV